MRGLLESHKRQERKVINVGEIKIDSEFQTLIPPLTDDEFQRLEKSILAEGVREPIITWNDTIIDGHNRYRICEKNGIDCPSVRREFESRDAAKIWICENQLGRRNLEPGQKAALAIERSEAEVRERARLRQVQAGIEYGKGSKLKLGVHGPQPMTEKGRTHEILAKQAGVSEATVKRVMGVKRKDPELYEMVKSGEVSARDAYRRVTSEKPKTTDDGRRICTVCGKPIDEGDCYKGRESVHRRCNDKRNNQHRYANPDISLLNNVATYTVESLLNELLASANSLRESWESSIRINESMGVKLSASDKKRLDKSVACLFSSIEKVKETNNV